MIRLHWIVLVFLCAIIGCSSDGRLRLHGKITYRGEPISANGRISFEPDMSQGGKDGPQAVGEIIKGEYHTNPGFGAVEGRHRVRITLMPPADAMADPANPVVPRNSPVGEFITNVDVKSEATNLDFDLPFPGN